MSAEEVLEGLDPEQRAVATAVTGPVCVLAGAGTGKTRAITHRIAYAVRGGTVPLSEVLAVTFTTRAAGELRQRLRALGVPGAQARTFHSAALRQLAYFFPKHLGAELPRVVPSKLPLLGSTGRLPPGVDLRDVAAEIEWAKSSLVTPETYPERAAAVGRQPPLPPDQLADRWTAYDAAKQSAGVMDFEDLLLTAAGLVLEEPRVAAEVRSRYRWFVVDEYQDVSPLQQRLLDAWLGDREEVCVVGDAGQTIYTFAGASPTYLLDFPDRYRDATVVRLVRDYRSTPEVVGVANAVRAGMSRREQLPLIAQQPPGPLPTYAEHPDEPAEAAAVAAACRRLVAGGLPAREIAILYRIHAQSESYEQALAQAGVPYVVRGAERFFERAEVRQALVLLRGAARFGEPAELVPAVRDVLSAAGWATEPPPGRGAARDRWESLAAIVTLAEEAAVPGLPEFVADLEERAASHQAPPVEGVTLGSLHAAKGLEWDAVFLVGVVDGTLPITYAVTPDQVAEERRLLYVGVTRARRHLAVSWALARAAGGRRGRRPSRFLDGLRPAPPQTASATRGASSSRRSAAERVGDVALFERLREWRSARAKELEQPAYCVFPDSVLSEIADRKPASSADLRAITGVGPRKVEAFAADVLAIVSHPTP